MHKLQVLQTDITVVVVDTIVNAANSSLIGGGGVDGTIHRAAGPQLLEECRTLQGCRPGNAKLTGGYNLKAKHVIHTVGPVWTGGHRSESAILRRCYFECLQLCFNHKLSSVAFPAISTGAYGFPSDLAARIAVQAADQWQRENVDYDLQIIFAVFDTETRHLYEKEINELL